MNNRIKELRKLNKISQKNLVSNLGITQQALSNYEKEKRIPDQPTWQALAKFFNVSVAYLKGIDDKTVIKKFSSEDLLQELLDRKVLEPVKDKPINLDDVFLLHK
ncbi:helix-turn-helix transcriptional regulator [Lactobacillus helveticus]|uniref:Helix-turn-helix domain-containing protein n=1 Tax=Lactobacillus helveticus TaxID=1587 RepID=A0A6A7K106_LACHE|nr:helix-turn-helix transcriptional regulator [Lactobacillus helveticus]MPW14185.1 helix-turn-helix domain-containing protein [Lactobacillus helveticus]